MFKPLTTSNRFATSDRKAREADTLGLPPSSAPATLAANRSTSTRPALVDRTVDVDLQQAWSHWRETGKPRTLARPLSDSERALVERRCADLQTSCGPFGPGEQDRAITAISAMLAGFRSLRHDDDELAIAGLDGLRRVLAPFPVWAIEEGCLLISRGEARLEGKPLDRRFPPNDSEVYGVVKERVRPYLEALDNATALLRAAVDDQALALGK